MLSARYNPPSSPLAPPAPHNNTPHPRHPAPLTRWSCRWRLRTGQQVGGLLHGEQRQRGASAESVLNIQIHVMNFLNIMWCVDYVILFFEIWIIFSVFQSSTRFIEPRWMIFFFSWRIIGSGSHIRHWWSPSSMLWSNLAFLGILEPALIRVLW
jgi:hypothetical protein